MFFSACLHSDCIPHVAAMSVLTKIKTRLLGVNYILAQYLLVPSRDFLSYLITPLHWRRNWAKRIVFVFGKSNINSDSLSGARIAVFVIYGSTISVSSFLQLASLAKCGFRTILVSNGSPLLNLNLLSSEHGVMAYIVRRNIGQDIGAYKDIIICLSSLLRLESIQYLGLFNDTLLTISSAMLDSFSDRLKTILLADDYDAIGLYENYAFQYHIGSYYMILGNSIVSDSKFLDFWHHYRPISNRNHAIRNGELAFSSLLLKNKRLFLMGDSSLLRISLLEFLSGKVQNEASPGHGTMLQNLAFKQLQSEIALLIPRVEGTLLISNEKILLYMKPFLDLLGCSLESPSQFVERFIFELEHSNQSHVGALMFPKFAGVPFVKKDICLHGLYSLSQVLVFFGSLLEVNIRNNIDFRILLETSDSDLEAAGLDLRGLSNHCIDIALFNEAVMTYRTKQIAFSHLGMPPISNVQKGVYPLHLHVYAGATLGPG